MPRFFFHVKTLDSRSNHPLCSFLDSFKPLTSIWLKLEKLLFSMLFKMILNFALKLNIKKDILVCIFNSKLKKLEPNSDSEFEILRLFSKIINVSFWQKASLYQNYLEKWNELGGFENQNWIPYNREQKHVLLFRKSTLRGCYKARHVITYLNT